MADKELSTFELNPANWLAFLGAVLVVLVSFGVNLTGDQANSLMKLAETAMLAVVPLLIGWFTRRQVVPVAKVEAAVGLATLAKIAHTTTKPAA